MSGCQGISNADPSCVLLYPKSKLMLDCIVPLYLMFVSVDHVPTLMSILGTCSVKEIITWVLFCLWQYYNLVIKNVYYSTSNICIIKNFLVISCCLEKLSVSMRVLGANESKSKYEFLNSHRDDKSWKSHKV